MLTIEEFINYAIAEDIGDGDHTSLAAIPETAVGTAKLLVKEDGIIAGIEIAKKVFEIFDKNLNVDVKCNDGEIVKKGDIVFFVSGSSRSILTAERLVLNFMQRMSGIATHTNQIVSKIKDLSTKILDTRKTTPNFRYFEKMAVKIGGGTNHRVGLYDMIMLKDNHIDYAGGITKAIKLVHDYLNAHNLSLKVEIEARTLADVEEILTLGMVDVIMLDNFTIENLKRAVSMINGRFLIEASGGITIDNVRMIAETGVDFISMGALTHHIKSLDLSLKAVK